MEGKAGEPSFRQPLSKAVQMRHEEFGTLTANHQLRAH